VQGENLEFLWSSEEINRRAHEYWPIVMDIARKNNVKRITRCTLGSIAFFPLTTSLCFETLNMDMVGYLLFNFYVLVVKCK
jgi:hypothetical protein